MNIQVDPWNISLSLASIILSVGGAIWLFVKHTSEKYIDQQFQKKIEEYKTNLQGVLETKKFDLQRMMLDFNLYRSKKHEIYPELFKLFLKATYGLNNLKNNWDFPLFQLLSKEFVERYLIEKSVGQKEIEYLTDRWLEDEEAAEEKIQDIKYAIKRLETKSVKNDYEVFRNYFLEVELFLSDEGVKVIQEIIQDFDEILENIIYDIFMISYEMDEVLNNKARTDTDTLYKQISLNVDKLKKQFKNELSVAEY
ncbi:hypothetical protein RQP50_27605 [Paenibacillus sp. chi10]|uniref:Uncharacterized protein n=1 Tax=Paenibacillus suaedae TaxID=3077233 RepID=A0AAJ2K1N4_9BACL|nr:hypothetical protein [Paenibacillus sp. chi10]MDT8980001.1 hypothetical protein [Paenibacillus sp. chi10]